MLVLMVGVVRPLLEASLTVGPMFPIFPLGVRGQWSCKGRGKMDRLHHGRARLWGLVGEGASLPCFSHKLEVVAPQAAGLDG